jgi:thioredoxin-related protein
MKLLAFLFAFTFLVPSAQWSTDFEKAKTTAAQDKKLILLNFAGSDWCIPCIKMKKDFFEADAFSAYADKNLVLVKADFPRLKKNKLDKDQTAKNQVLAAQYNPQGKFPFTVLIDANGKVLKSWDGLPKATVAAFVSQIQAAKK